MALRLLASWDIDAVKYEAVYSAFIADRQSRPVTQEYAERHHITPRSVGGSDDASNLILLSPEDHFFAHLLLAKIYGGMLWVPVVLWLGGDRRAWAGRRSRLAYGWAKREAVRSVRGEGAHQYDWALHSIEHVDGRTYTGTQANIHAGLGLTRSGLNMLLKGRIKSYKGWFIQGAKPKHIGRGSPGMDHHMARHETYSLHHVDGRSMVATQFELHRVHGLSKSAACLLVNGQRTVSQGWYIEGRPPSCFGRAAAYLQPRGA